MKTLKWIMTFALGLSSLAHAQEDEEGADADPSLPAAAEVTQAKPTVDPAVDMAQILSAWEKNQGSVKNSLPRRWLFLQEQAGVYGAPSPLNVDKISFDGYGWFQLAEAESIRLFVQFNPEQKKDSIKPEELPARLKRYAELSNADGILLKTAGENSSWALYRHTKKMDTPVVNFIKGPDSFRNDVPAAWLVAQLSYDAMVVGIEGDYLILAKLKPLKRGAQGLILKKSSSSIVADSEKDVGALLRIVYDSDDYALAKVSLSKSGRPKVPVGSKILFDQP
ncbi:MAG: hypothetical protein V4655_05895 [Bdellovibrionota bacterium]